MIQLSNLCLSFGEQILFNDITALFNSNQKVGLVGRNGAGKSTLLKVIAGIQSVDSGTVTVQKGFRIAYLPQEVVLASDKSVVDETFSAFEKLSELSNEYQELHEYFAHGEHAHDAEKLERFAQLQEELQAFDKEQAMVKTKKVLTGLGFSDAMQHKRVNELSTGWKMRVVLAKQLLQEADFYLFDEPTNHLDIVAREWFCSFLKASSVGFLLVSHDRYFLDAACIQTFELERGNGIRYVGNYTFYLAQKEKANEALVKKYNEQQREIKRKRVLIDKFRAKASKAKFAQSLIRELDKMERIQLPPGQQTLSFSVGPLQRSGKVVLKVDDVAVGYDTKPIVHSIFFEIERGEKVALIAANGVGKTTLFKAITGSLTPMNGTVNFGHNVHVTLFEQDQDKVLDARNTILHEVEDACSNTEARKRVRSLLGTFLFPGDDVHKKIGVLSGGEKNRVAMVKVLLQEANLLLLDEPTNHLDLISKEILSKALQAYKGTILFVSHDRQFLQECATKIIELHHDKAVVYPGNYEGSMYQKNNASVEQGAPSTQVAERELVAKKSNKELYEARKKLKRLEEKIDRLERRLAQQQESLSLLTYETPEYASCLQEGQKLQNDLKETMSLWESLHE